MFIIKTITGIMQHDGNIYRLKDLEEAIKIARDTYVPYHSTVYCEETDQAILPLPEFMLPRKNCIGDILSPNVCIDGPLVDEIRNLWSKGIRTTGCCSGHAGEPYIGVAPECIASMEQMGYIHRYNPNDGAIQCTFIPKTIN